ncbi:MAG: ribonuclease H family protein [Synergistaceae bacterium]
MAKKYYAVKQGHEPGIYKTWDECKKQVHGFPSATYKGFETKEEAENFMGITQSKSASEVETHKNTSEVTAYVDGSYDHTKREFAYGVVILKNNEEEQFSGKMSDLELVEMRNVAGEIKASERAMQYCIDNGIKSIDIYHDYEGIAKWCTGEWKTNKEGTKAYKSYYDSIKSQLKVTFVKVKGHSGDKYNEIADMLAKGALGIKK